MKENKDFIAEISKNWFINYFSKKINFLRNQILEERSDEITFTTKILDISTIDKLIIEMKENMKKLNNYNDIVIFIEKYTSKKEDIQKTINNQYKNTAFSDGVDTSTQTRLTELLIKEHISEIFKMIKKAFMVVTNIVQKLGENTDIYEIELNDVEYMLNKSIELEVSVLNEWANKNKKESANFLEELKILQSSESILKKADASHLIEHYFINIFSNDLDIENLLINDAVTTEKIKNISNGVKISELLLTKTSLCEDIYNEFRKILNS